MCSQGDATTRKDQEDERMKVKGGSRQSLKHIGGDVPLCTRKKEKDDELKSNESEKSTEQKAKAAAKR